MDVSSGRLVFLVFLTFLLFFQAYVQAQAEKFKPCDTLGDKKPSHCRCNSENDSECSKPGKLYKTHKRSPPVSHHTRAILTINSFEKGGDGGGPSACDGKYHSNDMPIVALSTRWFSNRKRCFKHIKINGNGRSVVAKVVDECDSAKGCRNDIVDASKAVWKALRASKSQWGWMEVTWSDA